MHRHRFVLTSLASVLAAAILSFAGGCAAPKQAYAGPPRPAAEVAVLRANTVDSSIGFRVRRVDGLEVNAQRASLALLPGTRRLDLRVTPVPLREWDSTRPPFTELLGEADRRYGFECQVTVTLEAGRRYRLDGAAEMNGPVTSFHLEDDESGDVLGRWDGRGNPLTDAGAAAPAPQ